MKGRQALAAHVPELRDGREPLIALVWVGVFAAAFAALRVVDRLWPAWSPLAQIACGLAGFLIAAQFFWRRRAFRARHGEQAYRLAFARFILPGLPLIFAALFHTLVAPGERILTADTTPVSRALGLYLLLTGGLLYLRAIGTFGLDNLAMLYVYFPEESRLVNTSIYGVLRHVVYSGMARIGLAFALWRGTWFSILFGLLMLLGLAAWLRWVEEPELIERFGDGYRDYRRRVPAFWPRLTQIGAFWKFLLGLR